MVNNKHNTDDAKGNILNILFQNSHTCSSVLKEVLCFVWKWQTFLLVGSDYQNQSVDCSHSLEQYIHCLQGNGTNIQILHFIKL
jgi:hypothetical protein